MADWKIIGGITALGGLIGYLGAKTVDSKKLPAGEKAVLTGASTGATMEGLDLALGAEGFVYFYTLDEDGFGDHYDTLEEAQAAVATSSKPMEIYERREDIHEPYKMDKRMGAESFSALDYELNRNDCCELWVEKLYNSGKIGFGEAGNLLAAIEMDGLKCSQLGGAKCNKKAESHDFSQKSAEGDYEPRFYSLGERIGWMEFALADEYWYQYEDDYIDVVLDIEEWNENNANNSKLSNLVKQYKDRSSFRAESDDLKLRQRQAWTLTYHDKAENKHKYYMVVSYGDKYYGIFGRLAGYDRAMTIAVTKPMSINEVQNKINEKKFIKGYLADDKTGAKDWNKMPTASQIKEKIEEKYPSSPSPKSEPKKQQSKPMNRYEKMARRKMGLEAEQSESVLKKLKQTYDMYESTNQHTSNYLLLATFFGTDAEKEKVKKIIANKNRKGYLTQADNQWLYKNINPYYDNLRNVKNAENFEAERGCYPCPNCGTNMFETPTQYGRFGSIGTHCSCYKCGSNYISKEMNAEDLTAYQWVMQELRDGGSLDTQAYDYLAMTFTLDELEAGAKDSMRQGNNQVASDFVKAINRQNFINEYQTEENR